MAAASPSKILGTLVVVVIRAKNLRDKHTFTKQDPFVTVQLGKEKKSTEIDKRGGQHPVWDVDLHLAVAPATSKEARTLKVSCFAKEPREDVLVGAGEVDITEILEKGEFDDWVTLKEDDAYRGEVYLEMTFFPATNTKPHSRRKPQMPQSERLQLRSHSPVPPTSNVSNEVQSQRLNNHDNVHVSSPKRTEPLPVPSALLPGRPHPQTQAHHVPLPVSNNTQSIEGLSPPSKIQHVPSVLRPGNTKASPIPLPNPLRQPAQPSSYNNGEYSTSPLEGTPLPFPGERSSKGTHHSQALPPLAPPFASFPSVPPGATSSYTSVGNNAFGNEYYADRERAALARASQEEADKELARMMSQDDAASGIGGGASVRASQEQADEELARAMAQNEGVDLERLRREEADREMAQKLARELNSDVIGEGRASHPGQQEERQPIPGGW